MTHGFYPVIGLEVHVQLSTDSKIFCGCKADVAGDGPNTSICPICAGLPGALPVLNKRAVEYALRLGLALGCDVAPESYFHRKNYFYPDLPKGYQISQYDIPLMKGGSLSILRNGQPQPIAIDKIHLEEDAGSHKRVGNYWCIDFNRCGVPLLEMVTKPVLRSAGEAAQFAKRVRELVRFLRISRGDMNAGNLRCDGNVSIQEIGNDELPEFKWEIKNLNSFNYLERALDKAIDELTAERLSGKQPGYWTLDYDENRNTLRKQRAKENVGQYRYFREPDLLAIEVSDTWKEQVRATMPKLPQECREQLIRQDGLPEKTADDLIQEPDLLEYYEKARDRFKGRAATVANAIQNYLGRLVNETANVQGVQDLGVPPKQFADLLNLIEDEIINASVAEAVLQEMIATGKDARAVVEDGGLTQIGDRGELVDVCKAVLAGNPQAVQEFHDGKPKVFGFLLGQVMTQTNKKADPKVVRELLQELLKG